MLPTPPQPFPSVPKLDQIVALAEEAIGRIRRTREKILATITPDTATFANVIQPRAELWNEIQAQLGMIWVLGYSSPDKEVHDEVDKVREMMRIANAEWMSDYSWFELVKAVADGDELLDAEDRLWLKDELSNYTRCGHGILTQEQIEKYLEGRNEIDAMRMRFAQNLRTEKGGLWLSLEDLDGVPSTYLDSWKGSEAFPGKKFVPFANGGAKTVITYANNAETRKQMYLANDKKVPDNVALFKDVIVRRDAQARVLGHASHSAFRVERRAAKSAEWVHGFLKTLRDDLAPRGGGELELLKDRRRAHLQSRGVTREHGDFPPWDQKYYQRLAEEELDIDQVKISEFFPLEHTAPTMLEVFAEVLGLRFTLVPQGDLDGTLIWHESVQVWSVWDERNEESSFIGYLYFDLVWRENKYQGFQNVTIEHGYLEPNGTRRFPSTILMCAFPAPTAGGCILLKHGEVVTLFHELGHGIHNLLSRTKHARYHGTNLPPDFGEMPSVMLENWCWMKDVLKRLSCHFSKLNSQYKAHWREKNAEEAEPSLQIPDELLENLIKGRKLNLTMWYLHQLVVSIFDMAVHSPKTHEEIENLDAQKLWYDLREQIEGLDMSEARLGGHDYVTFSHLLAGYDAGYYSYLTAHAWALDVFQSVFAKCPHDKDTWERYRRDVLGYGGASGDELQLLADFLGRPSNSNALVEYLSGSTSS